MVKKLLTYHKNKDENGLGLPFVMVTRLSAQAPEVMFMLMYRLHFEKDCFTGKNKIGLVKVPDWSSEITTMWCVGS